MLVPTASNEPIGTAAFLGSLLALRFYRNNNHSITRFLSEITSSTSSSEPPLDPELELPRTRSSSTEILSSFDDAKVKSAQDAIRWCFAEFGHKMVMTSSFGMQSAILLHMASRIAPNIPVIFIDTGYLPVETYRFANALEKRFDLNIKVYGSQVSAARMEALYGKLWESEDASQERMYGILRKVEPMQRAMISLDAKCLLSGVRGKQTKHRQGLKMMEHLKERGYFKVHPIIDWTAEDVEAYIKKHDLPYHPLKKKGYVSVGDAHSSRPKKAGEAGRSTRFNGKRAECGMHTETTQTQEQLQRLVDNIGSPSRSRNNSSNNLHAEQQLYFFHGSNKGFEIYGRDNCRYCDAAKMVLKTYKKQDFLFYNVQKYNKENDRLEPEECDGCTCVQRADLVERIEADAPGEENFTTVPQIFHNGKYVGGFTELCLHFNIPESVYSIFIAEKSENISSLSTFSGEKGEVKGVSSVRDIFDMDLMIVADSKTPASAENSAPPVAEYR